VTPLHVVAAVIFDNGQILACRRNPDRAAGGLWEFPGGKVEPGEIGKAALVREIAEELGTEIVVDEEITTDDTHVDGHTIRLTCFRARLVGPRPVRSSDHDSLLWLDPATLRALAWAQPDLPAVSILSTGY
jgi:8-oxo-dGTP diphosphatase